jgi:ankyrin repeat protein
MANNRAPNESPYRSENAQRLHGHIMSYIKRESEEDITALRAYFEKKSDRPRSEMTELSINGCSHLIDILHLPAAIWGERMAENKINPQAVARRVNATTLALLNTLHAGTTLAEREYLYTTPNNRNYTPYLQAVLSGSTLVVNTFSKMMWEDLKVQDFCRQAATPNQQGVTPLLAATETNNFQLVKLVWQDLLKSTSGMEKTTQKNFLHSQLTIRNQGNTLLSSAIETKDKYTMGALLDILREAHRQNILSTPVLEKMLTQHFLLPNHTLRISEDHPAFLVVNQFILEIFGNMESAQISTLLDPHQKDEHDEEALASRTASMTITNDQPVLDDKKKNESPRTPSPSLALSRNSMTQKLCDSVVTGDISKIKELIANKANVNGKIADSYSPLMFASSKDNVSLVNLLIASKADINGKANNDTPALVLARSTEMTRVLLDNKANINAKSKSGSTALMRASTLNHQETVTLLLDRKATIGATNLVGRTALHFAAYCGHNEVVKILVDKNADLSIKDKQGFSPLHLAAVSDKTQVTVTLLERKANIEVRNNNNNTPLMSAALKGSLNSMEVLLNRKADVNSGGESNQTPLMEAVFQDSFVMVDRLVKAKADINLESIKGESALRAAAIKGNKEILLFLIESKANVGEIQQAFLAAVDWEQAEMITPLVNAKADIHARFPGDWNCTALSAAALINSQKVARVLIDMNCNVNAVDLNGMTPLMSASMTGSIAVMEMLLDAKADITMETWDDSSALYWATECDQAQSVWTLLNRKASLSMEHQGKSARAEAKRNHKKSVEDCFIQYDIKQKRSQWITFAFFSHVREKQNSEKKLEKGELEKMYSLPVDLISKYDTEYTPPAPPLQNLGPQRPA